MLSKLFKYEFKATARIFLPLYAVLLVFAGINKLISAVSEHRWETPEIISMALYVIILVGMFVMTLVVMIQRFYKNLLSDEGYLMFTLPAASWKHVVSKLVVSMVWTVASSIAALVSIIVIAFDQVFTSGFWKMMINAISNFFSYWNASAAWFTLEMIIAGIISLASSILIIYASIAIGHLFNQHRVLASLGAFLALNTISQILFAIAGSIIGTAYIVPLRYGMADVQIIEPLVHSMMWFGIIFFGILSAGYFFITNYILSKRLNLE